MATTPPLRTATHTPPTPLHGARYDAYHPYSTTRKSTRHSSSRRQRAVETPPPKSVDLSHNSTSLDPKKSNTLRSAAHLYSPPSSTHTSPRRKGRRSRMQNQDQDQEISTMNGVGLPSEATSLDSFHGPDGNPSLQQPFLQLGAGMLPTPAKTPRKKPVQPTAVNAAARVLFPARPDTVEDAMPTPRKRRNRRNVGFSLYSSMEDEGDPNPEDKIQVYTDSKDKVPELDPSQDNPFYEQPGQDAHAPEPMNNNVSKKRKAGHSVEGKKEIEEAFKREEGMVYVFRGKKVYRKFPEDSPDANEANGEEDSSNVRPLTRSSIKPRLLFPSARQVEERTMSNIEDEEAPTDIEEVHDREMTDVEEQEPITPVKSTVFSPATPPTTGHATRQATKKTALDRSFPTSPAEPVEAVPYALKGKKVSPFDGWARTKAGTGGVGKGKKREGEALEKGEGTLGSKKVRGNSVA